MDNLSNEVRAAFKEAGVEIKERALMNVIRQMKRIYVTEGANIYRANLRDCVDLAGVVGLVI